MKIFIRLSNSNQETVKKITQSVSPRTAHWKVEGTKKKDLVSIVKIF